MKLDELVARLNAEPLTYKGVSNIIENYGYIVVGVHTVGASNSAYTQKYIICKAKNTSRKEFMVTIK